MKKFVVVGGGTAGWLSALYARKVLPEEYSVSVIESSSIGILGAGEGSSPQLVDLLDFLEIPTASLIKKCNATIKNGIKFTNWNNDDLYYYDNFLDSSVISNENFWKIGNIHTQPNIDFRYLYSFKKNESINNYSLINTLSDNNKVPFSIEGPLLDNNTFLDFEQHSLWSIHFDASLFAKFLKDVGVSRNISIIDAVVQNIIVDENGFIKSIDIGENDYIDCDFVIDCTGFKRLIIGSFYNSEWISYDNYLPVNSALPFFLKKENKIEPYTESIGMKYGWMWKVPLQNRYGSGYVFDSNHITFDEAKKEVELKIGQEIEIPKTFSFSAGTFKEIWIKNCLAVGLASGFLEPLEATSIFQLITNLKMFFSDPENWEKNNDDKRNWLNKNQVKYSQQLMECTFFHYMTKRNDTDFWKEFKTKEKPDFINYLLEVCSFKIPDVRDIPDNMMCGSFAFMAIIFGNNIIEKNILDSYKIFEDNAVYCEFLKKQASAMQHDCISHNAFLEMFNDEKY